MILRSIKRKTLFKAEVMANSAFLQARDNVLKTLCLLLSVKMELKSIVMWLLAMKSDLI
jgi:hypothetical protein